MKTKLKNIIDALGEEFKAKKYTLVTAESCTGGGLAYFISQNPNCSAILERGYITYSNTSKEDLLGVKNRTIYIEGAVSEQTAKEMAEGALKNSKAQISVAVTGIAAEDEASPGLVWISCAGIDRKTVVYQKKYKGTRRAFMEKVITEALLSLIKFVKD